MLANTLKHLGPCLSTELTDYLVKSHGLTSAAARQRVSRGAPQIKRLAYLPFPRRARFLYHQDDYASPWYWRRLYEAIFATNGPYARALGAVQARDVVRLADFPGVCGAPLAQRKQLSADTVLERLLSANVFVKHALPGLGICVMTKKTYEHHQQDLTELAAATRARLIAEGVLLDSLREWLRRLSIVSYDKVRTRGSSAPRVATFAWDLSAPSYLTSVVTRLKNQQVKPGWVACDVLLVDNVQLVHAEPFLHKVRSIGALKNIGRTMFILVAQSYTADAFHALRSAGVIPATPASLFGQDVAEGFRDLIETLNQATMGIVEPDRLGDLLSRLGRLEGALGNMRGAFFELLVAEVVRKKAAGQVRLNVLCRGEDGEAEVDVYHLNPGIEVQIIECKGIAPSSTVDEHEIDAWLTKRIVRVRDHLQSSGWTNPRPRFELWTSGKLSPQDRERVERTRWANRNKFEIEVIEGEALRARVKAVNDQSLLNTFEQHFLPQTSI